MKFLLENGIMRETMRHTPEATVAIIDLAHIIQDIHHLFVWTNLSLFISLVAITARLCFLARRHLIQKRRLFFKP